METSTKSRSKRSYERRSDEQRIADLQQKIQDLQVKAQAKVQKEPAPDHAVLKSIPKLARHLRKFADLAMSNGRQDIATSTWAFMAGLERNLGQDEPARRRRGESQGPN
ncbi:MAG TPA: hypothetical protein VK843_11000 [Planctomycetota bacterium]|nr:hypothetical protein [Planctomycetota bacterium]